MREERPEVRLLVQRRIKKPGSDGFPPGSCAAKGCKRASEMVDATHRFSNHDIPFCCDCWASIDDEWFEITPRELRPKCSCHQDSAPPPAPALEPEPEDDLPEPILFVKSQDDEDKLAEDIAASTQKPKLFG